jgi:HAD superfamily hydrolase (TIGR01458 family)
VKTKLICLDVDGTLTDGIGGPVLPGIPEAIRALREHLPIRFVTNATSRSHRTLVRWLTGHGLLREPGELVTPATLARQVLGARQQTSGLLLVDEAARADFDWFSESADGPAVILASEAHDRTILDLQPAFRALLAGADLYALQQNRYFRRRGELVTDLGPVAAFLAYASGRPVQNLGKPSPLLFDTLAREVGATRAEMVMVGDDAEFDASGAVALGMTGILVRTGKYRDGDEARVSPPPSAVIESVVTLSRWLGLPA